MRAAFLAGVENVVDPKLTKSDAKYLADLKADLKRVQDVADEVAKRAQQEYVGHYNKRARIKVFAVNDQVLVLRPYMHVARVNQVEVVVDKEKQLEILRVCPLLDDIVQVPEAVRRFGKLDLTHLSSVG